MADIAGQLRDALRDHYLLEREFGRGGMATVYLARDLKHERLVALKVLHPEMAATVGSERLAARWPRCADVSSTWHTPPS